MTMTFTPFDLLEFVAMFPFYLFFGVVSFVVSYVYLTRANHDPIHRRGNAVRAGLSIFLLEFASSFFIEVPTLSALFTFSLWNLYFQFPGYLLAFCIRWLVLYRAVFFDIKKARRHAAMLLLIHIIAPMLIGLSLILIFGLGWGGSL